MSPDISKDMMKRILFVSIANLYLCPYIQKYINAIGDRAEYDIVYWDRHGVNDGDYGARKTFVYNKRMSDFVSKAQKLAGMAKYCHFAAKVIRREKYDGIIVLHSNAAVFLYTLLRRKYKGRYIYDIRDYSFEGIRLFYEIEKRLIETAAVTFISSDGFRKFLPEHEYQLVHNNVKIDPAFIREFRASHQGHTPLRISFIGMVRFFEQGKQMASRLGNDNRFHINYFGKNANLMCEAVGKLDNHTYMDQFPPEMTLELYRETDMINNVYGNHDPYVDYLSSNKLYYCTLLGLPILVSPETFMAELVEKHQIGFVFDHKDPHIADKLYDYYKTLDWNVFYNNCDAFCRMVEEDDKMFDRTVQEFIS